jgi:hypothetical protein
MTHSPMNPDHQNGQTQTIIESPIWIGRLYTFLPTFWITWFVMFPIPFLFPHKWIFTHGLVQLFHSSIPLVVAIFIDENFVQKFLMPAWERSKNEDHITIRGVSYPKIREWIEWNILFRKKIILGSAIGYTVLTIFSDNIDHVMKMILLEIVCIIAGTLSRTWFGFKRFGFMSWYFSDVSSFVSHNNSNRY